jgi:rRNA maturation RNase YbeY
MEPPRRPLTQPKVTLVNDTGRRIAASLLKRAVASALSGNGHANAEVCLLLTSDERIAELNFTFRGLDEPTDVLSFPSGLPGFLGDIAISVPYAFRQAAARGVPLEHELAFLAIHGTLHLLGFDDEHPADRAQMISAMNQVARWVGLPPDEEWGSILHAEAAWA